MVHRRIRTDAPPLHESESPLARFLHTAMAMSEKAWPRILPFALFMAFIGLDEGLHFLNERGWIDIYAADFFLLYPLRPMSALLALLLLRRAYTELDWTELGRPAQTLGSIGLGLAVFALWINMDWAPQALGQPAGFDPTTFPDDGTRLSMIAARIAGAVVVVPIMEELFWRSFLLRYIITPHFSKIPVGTFTRASFLACAGLFGLAHHFIVAGIMAGMAYSWLLYRTKSIAQCVLAHAVTNLALAVYVLEREEWRLW